MTSDIQERIDALGRRLGRSVVLNDPDIHLVLASEHFGDEDPVRIRAMLHRNAGSGPIGYLLGHGISRWTRAGHVPPSTEHELLARLVAPVRLHGELLGFIVVIDRDQDLTAAEIDLVEDLAREAAGLIVAERHATDERSQALERHLLAWLGPEAAGRADAVRELESRGLLAAARHLQVVVLEAVESPGKAPDDDQVDLALRHALESAPRLPRGATLHAVADGRGVLVLASPVALADEVVAAHAEALLGDVDSFAADRFGSRVGIGEPVADPGDAWRSRRQAELACRAVPVLGGRTARWGELGPLSVLLRIPAEELDDTAVPAALDRLLAVDPSGRLLESLQAYLDRGGSGAAAAIDLHVHRTTLYYRLDRIREATGLDLDDGRVRLELHLGLTLRRLLAAR
ncbi:helix-turn-helix domain-containing protein [Nocardioides sp. C4-1]|uniref:PucR family transcriptional regulator n=1 Tax=Nocardioides sp. C4-1 TaxID=3151851 RepID=UPI00326485A3